MEQVFGLISFYINCPKAFRGFALLCKKAALCCHGLQDLKKNQFTKFTLLKDHGNVQCRYIICYTLPDGRKHGKEIKIEDRREFRKFRTKNNDCSGPLPTFSKYIISTYVNGKAEGRAEEYFRGKLCFSYHYKNGLLHGKYTWHEQWTTDVHTYIEGRKTMIVKYYVRGILSREQATRHGMVVLTLHYDEEGKVCQLTNYYHRGKQITKAMDYYFDKSGNKVE